MSEIPADQARVSALRTLDFRYPISMVPGVVAALDVAIILVCALMTCDYLIILSDETRGQYLFASVFIAFVSVSLFQRADLYELNALMRPLRNSDTILAAVVTSFLFLLSILFALKSTQALNLIWVSAFAGASVLSIFGGRMVVYFILRGLGSTGRIGRSFVVLGAGEQAEKFLFQIDEAKPYLTNVLGYYANGGDRRPEKINGYSLIGDTEQLLADVRAGLIDDVVIAMPWYGDGELTRTIERLKELPINVHISTDLVGFRLRFRPIVGTASQLSVFEIEQRPIAGWSSLLKTIEDYVLATVFLILLSPILLIVAIAIKLDDGGSVFFMQKRLGFNNRTFEIYKFRSMHERSAPEEVVVQATRHDPRVTRVGRFIRATSIDELPQLLNVLNGTMSLVGPRPHALSHNEEYGKQIRGYFARHKVKPGLTGWAQVNGLRGETEDLEKMRDRIRHDVYYAENWSLLFDLRIIIGTALVLLFQRSAY